MPILFYSKSEEYSEFSNFSEHGFKLDGKNWASVEHYYQAQKYNYSEEIMEKIRSAPTAHKAMKAGRDRGLKVRPDWEDVKVEVMKKALHGKFSQNRRIKELLLNTGGKEIVHQSKSDYFWGSGEDGSGENLLGIMLMELRGELKR